MRVVGVDAYSKGWVAVALQDGRFDEARLVRDFAAVLAGFPDAERIGVDIPTGLPERGGRPADRAARAFVGPRRSSVFPTPPRGAIEAATYAEARAAYPSLSAQSYALGKKILEVDGHLDDRVIEVHPEVSFRELAGEPLAWPKRTWNGLMERRRLLTRVGIVLPERLEAGEVPPDDVLDAAAAAWSADRYARGVALPLPDGTTERIGAIWR